MQPIACHLLECFMQYSIYIDQQKALEWGLNLQQAAIFDYMTRLAIWAETATIDGRVFYHIRRGKLAAELPLVSDAPQTYKRHMAALERAGVIEMRLIGTTPFVRITAKGGAWGQAETGAKLHQSAQNCAGSEPKMPPNRCKTAPEPVQNCTTINYTNINQEQEQEIYAPSGACVPVKAGKIACPDDVNPQAWADVLANRKAKRLPMTRSALAGIEREAAKAGITLGEAIEVCAAEGWAGFKASWQRQQVRTWPVQPQQVGKQMTGIMALEEMKNAIRKRMAVTGNPDGTAKAVMPVVGSDARR